MTCPSCGALLHLSENEESFRCEYCRSVYTPQPNDDDVRVLGEKSPLACPICALALEQAALAGHRVLYCTKCRGMLVSMTDFVALILELRATHTGLGNVQPAADRKGFDRHLTCPQCHQPMDTHFYEGPGNIIIDDCSRCFLNWLDQGELMRVVRAPDHAYAEDHYGRHERET
jgi:Zn-finger nucleic acid-binding protein